MAGPWLTKIGNILRIAFQQRPYFSKMSFSAPTRLFNPSNLSILWRAGNRGIRKSGPFCRKIPGDSSAQRRVARRTVNQDKTGRLDSRIPFSP